MVRVETTLSLAMKPVISAVDTRQSAKPSGAKRGAMQLATSAKMLSCGSAVKLSCGSKFCKNQMTMVAIKITVKARSKKSRAFSQSSWQHILQAGEAVVGQLHHKGHSLAPEEGPLERKRREDAYR